jgi:hypothetical protein
LIYTLDKDDQKLAMVLKSTLEYTFDFKAYLFVNQYLEEGTEKQQWRNKLLARARQAATSHFPAMLFSFQLLAHEGNYKKMVDYADSSATYEVLLQFADKMALADHQKFLYALIYRLDHQHDHDTTIENLQPTLTDLSNILLKRYQTEELTHTLKSSEKTFRYLTPNKFIVFMRAKLGLPKPANHPQ